MRRLGQYVASAVISLSLIATSTAAVAASESVPAAPSSDGWMALSMLTPNSASAINTSTLAAAAQSDVPPPPPPPNYYGGPGTPPVPVLVVWLLVLATFIYIVTKGNSNSKPNSPA